jgi:diguanylate cyclase (GGDEF)-like protein/PAS domain S-box-containing protein
MDELCGSALFYPDGWLVTRPFGLGRGGRPAAGVHSVAQPIVDLDTGRTVGYEALARGNDGRLPAELFAAAAASGDVAALDWECRRAALRGALDAGLAAPLTLFVNAEPSTLLSTAPPDFAALVEQARAELPLMLEITERDLAGRPADLLASLMKARRQGWGIAVDDVGAVDTSLALLPVLRPDVIKLDLRLVQQRTTSEVAAVVSAVLAESERSGAVLLAEGIETEQQAELALALGARLGQGYFFGRPVPLPSHPSGVAIPVLTQRSAELPPSTTPWSMVSDNPTIRRATKPLLLALSRHLERQARTGQSVVLSTFQSYELFTPLTAARYAALAQDNAFIAVFGRGIPDEPSDGVRGISIADDDPLRHEWDVVVLGPHFAAALIARDLEDADADAESERGFDYVVTHDREIVVRAARALMARIPPRAAGAAVGNRPPSRLDETGLDHGPALLASLRSDDRSLDDGLLARAVHASPFGVTVASTGADQPLVYVNAAFERLSGYPAAMLLGRNCRILQGPETSRETVAELSARLRGGDEASVTVLNYRPDGSTWYNELYVSPFVNDAGRVTHYIGIQEDVTARVEADRKVHHLAWHDPLTGLANRSMLAQHLDTEIERARETGTAVALLYLDLDEFKAVNDRFGHAAGDRLLLGLADRLSTVVRAGDLLARHGGDEFLVVMSGIRNAPHEAARRVANGIRESLRVPLVVDGHDVSVGVSIGMAVFPAEADGADGLLAAADRAMYAEKSRGGSGRGL